MERMKQDCPRPAVGQTMTLPGYGECVVQSTDDPSIVTLRTASGGTLRIGDKALRLALLAASGADVRPTT